VLRPGSSLSKAADACPRAILGLPLHLGTRLILRSRTTPEVGN
jgi:hypothetical protein